MTLLEMQQQAQAEGLRADGFQQVGAWVEDRPVNWTAPMIAAAEREFRRLCRLHGIAPYETEQLAVSLMEERYGADT